MIHLLLLQFHISCIIVLLKFATVVMLSREKERFRVLEISSSSTKWTSCFVGFLSTEGLFL